MTQAPELSSAAGFTIREAEPLARHLPSRVGGRCDAFVVVHRRDSLADAIAACRDAGWKRTILGAGTRTVVRDGGLAGAVIRLGAGFMGWEPTEDGAWVGAATPLAVVGARLPGCERLLGCPGTLGASVVLDPLWSEVVAEVRYLDRGKEKSGTLQDVQGGGNAVLCAARLVAPARPLALGPSRPGGWFSPVPDDDVNEVLRDAALADMRLRDVMMPSGQPELLVNLGGGSAKDLALLQRSAMERVLAQRGVQLEDAMNWLGRS